MKSLILTLALLSPAAMAQAETFRLFSKGAWNVFYDTGDGRPFCVAAVSGDGVYFSVDITRDSLKAWYISEANNFGDTYREGEVSVWIDRHIKWDTPAGALNNTIQMFGLDREFIAQLYDGRKLWIDQDFDGRWDAWFSLSGSAAALNALADCGKKL